MKFHVITGTPRSGSTLLCNILNQNPKFHASDTSALPSVLNSISYSQSISDEVLSDLANDREATEDRASRVHKAVVEAWYANNSDKVVFDKSRGWVFSALELSQIYPEAKMLIMVRDPRDIFASAEKQHRKNPIFSTANGPNEKTMFDRASNMLSPDAFIGQPIIGVEDIIRRDQPNQMIIEYNALSSDPELILRRVYKFLGEDEFKHDFDNVEDKSKEVDALWLNKFPHEGKGKVKPSSDHWSTYVDEDTAANIMNTYPYYNNMLGYK